MLMATKRGSEDSGCCIIIVEFRISPTNIKKTKLNPMENTMVSVLLDVPIPSAFRIRKPGIRRRYRETRTCRIKGISATIEMPTSI